MKLKLTPNHWSLAGLIFIELFALFLISPILHSGLPPGIDTPSHLFSSWFLTKSLQSGVIPGINPYWYTGQSFGVFYPPLPYYCVALLALLIKNVVLSYKIVTVAVFLLTPLTVYLVSIEFGLERKYSLISTFLFTASYAYISDISVMGRFTTGFALPFLVLSLFFLLRLKKGVFKNALFGGICLGILILSHQISTYSFLLIAGIYFIFVVIRFISTKSLKTIELVAVMCVIGAIVASWWLVPFVSRINEIGYQRTVAGGYSVPISFWKNQIFRLNSINTRAYPFYIGYMVVFLGVIGAVALLVKKELLLILITVLMFLLSLGIIFPFFHDLPYYNNLDVARFFLYGTVFLAILSGFGFAKIMELSGNKIVFIIMAAIIISTSAGIGLRSREKISTWQITPALTESFQWLRVKGEPGRVYGMGMEFWDAYLLPVYADRQIPDGWLHESAKNWRDIVVLDNMEAGIEPVNIETYYNILKSYDTTYILLGNHIGDHYFPQYDFNMYNEYVQLFENSNHFKEVIRFGDVIIFKVVQNE